MEIALWIFVTVDFFLFVKLIYASKVEKAIEESIRFERKVRMIQENEFLWEPELAELSEGQLN